MPPSPTEPKPPNDAVTTCTCGYDLTGLPSDAAAKCPECGVVISDLPTRPPLYDQPSFMIMMCFTPLMLGLSGVLLSALAQPWQVNIWVDLVLYLLAALSQWVLAIPAANRFVRLTMSTSTRRHQKLMQFLLLSVACLIPWPVILLIGWLVL